MFLFYIVERSGCIKNIIFNSTWYQSTLWILKGFPCLNLNQQWPAVLVMEPPKYPETITQPSNSVSADKIAKSHTLQIKWDQLFRLIPFCPCPLGKRQQGYLIGDSQKPTATEHDCLTWESENSMVIAWLVSNRKKFGTLPRLFFQILSMFLSPFLYDRLNSRRRGKVIPRQQIITTP